MADEPVDADDSAALARLEEVLLGGPRTYTRAQVAELTGVPDDVGRRIWRALGFPDVDDDEAYFTDGDVEALRTVRRLESQGIVDLEIAVTNARALARQLGRLADWQVGIFLERFLTAENSDLAAVTEAAPDLMAHLVPSVEQLVVFVWRRQLASAGGRVIATTAGQHHAVTLAVGFADLVGYTRLVRGLDEAELDTLLEAFESRASDLVAQRGGRLVKTIGDEVMFVADDVSSAVAIGVELAESLRADDGPDVRIGIAWGVVLARLGDYYGTTVNLASRLTSLGKPGRVLLDPAAASELAGHADFSVKQVPRMRVRGFGLVDPFVVRRRLRK